MKSLFCVNISSVPFTPVKPAGFHCMLSTPPQAALYAPESISRKPRLTMWIFC